ncbi:MAG: hypothetical protein Q7S22_06610 [Candidatus Micrarchaeota archaeon]|nr:hypothetical protein [Candidatus Micrarchaeota archaeon]
MMLKKLLPLFMVVLLLSFSYAIPALPASTPVNNALSYIGSCNDDAYTRFISDLGGPIGVVIVLIVLIIALSFMIGSVTNNQNFVIFYKDELFHLLVSVIMLVSIFSVFYFTCVVSTGFLGETLKNLGEQGPNKCFTGTETPQLVARCYTADIERVARNAFRASVTSSIREEMDSTFTIGIFNPFTGGIVTPIGAYKRTASAQLDMIANTFLSPVLTSIIIQRIFLQFSTDIVAFIIPVALFLRFLPPTRQMGNLFLALALGIYVIVPTIYAVNSAMDSVISSNFTCQSLTVEKGGLPVSIVNDSVMGDCDSPNSFWVIARLIPYAYFLPNFTLAIFITFMSAINKALKVIT